MKRFYREQISHDELIDFNVSYRTSDLFISADKDLSKEAKDLTIFYRHQIQDYISMHPEFESSLEPVELDPKAPPIVKQMMKAAHKANVGPMAAVAGATAEYVGKGLLKYSSNVIVENGGDIFLSTNKDRTIGIYAGNSPLTGKIGVVIKKAQTPCGICTSSGTFGHSLSFGKAEAVVIFSNSAILADAVATATGNCIKKKSDIEEAIKFAKNINTIFGIIIIYGSKLGSWGDLEIVNLKNT